MNIYSLLNKYGSPLYVFDDKAFVENYNNLCYAFRKEYANYTPGYSYKTNYTPNMDCGDNVIIINADKCVMTGKKFTDRVYLSYTGYPGGQRECTPEVLMKKSQNTHIKAGKHPLYIKVVKGMLPKTKLGARQLDNMYVYNSAEHPHAANNPKVIDINKLK